MSYSVRHTSAFKRDYKLILVLELTRTGSHNDLF